MQIQGAINSMLHTAAAGAYAIKTGVVIPAQRARERASVADANLIARQTAMREQRDRINKRREAYGDVKDLPLGDGKTVRDLNLSNEQLKNLRLQYFGTTRRAHGDAKK